MTKGFYPSYTPEVMRRIAAPMVGGMISATLLTLALIPAVFLLWQRRSLRQNPELLKPFPGLNECGE